VPAAAEDVPVETQPSAAAPAAQALSKADVRRLIERGHMRDGIAAARATIDADPSDAETYLLLGAALQELGQWKESMAVFGRCVEQATKGPKGECRALRGR
jgi:Flp pilus assembly protein TadD